jgi:hypothetical protein
MYRHGVIWRILAAVLLVGFLTVGGVALYRAGWANGYQAAALASASGGQSGTSPAPLYGTYGPGFFWPGFGFPFFFFPFGPLLGFGFLLLVFFLISRLFFRPWGWRRWGGPYGPGDWSRSPHGEQENKEGQTEK